MKRIIVIVLIISLMFALVGCEAVIDPQTSVLGAYVQDEQQQQETIQKTEMSALYYKDMDTNPVTTTCYANSEILKLVYCPLIRTDDNFKPYCVLAENYVQSGLTLTVKLRSDLLFSDGTAVTAADVVKSFDAAKKNTGSPYNRQVNLMERYYAEDDLTFVCILQQQVLESAALLDIPIMKNGESGIGCGPYIFSQINGKNVLVVNESYFETPSVPVIYLLETKNDENITSLFSAGELDIILAAQNSSLSLTSLRDYSIISYPSNNFIYIGINFANEKLADPTVRRALSKAIDRDSIASQSLVGLADSAEYPFNPNWYCMDNITAKYTDDVNLSVLGDLSFSMAIPSGSDIKKTVAQGISDSLKACGVTLNIIELDPAQFEVQVKNGAYDLYLGETAISRTMDPTFLYASGAALNYGGYSDAELDAAFLQFKNSEITLMQYLDQFSSRMPVIPVVFRKNVIYCDKNITGFTMQSPWNSFGNFLSVRLT